MPRVDPLRRLQKLSDPFILHQTEDGKEHGSFSSVRRRLRRIFLRQVRGQVYAGAGNDPAFSGKAALFLHEIAVSPVLEKHAGSLFQPQAVQKHNQLLQKPFMLQSGAQPRDVGQIRRFRPGGRQSAVDIGLDGIGKHRLRPVTLHQPSVKKQELQILCRVHAPPFKGGGEVFAAQCPDALHIAGIRDGNQHPPAFVQKRLQHLPAEVVQAGIAVG